MQIHTKTLSDEVSALGAKDMDACMQCGNCAAACPLSQGENTFPRKIYRYLQLDLKEKLLSSPEPWLCYYCGDCNTDCPRGAEPAETMMASRRWLTTQYDWTGLAAKFYASPKWEVGAFMMIFFVVAGLFLSLHGPVITDKVELNTFAPVYWVHLGDEIMFAIVGFLLISNAINMYFKIMDGTHVPLKLYLTELPVFIINYFTQKKWRKCGTGPSSAWWRHLFLFSGWVAMEVLIMIFLTSFQTDIIHPFWHPTRIVGYYATVALMLGSGTMLYSRFYKKEENLHRYSDFTDLFFLILIFIIAFTGITLHIVRLAGLPLTTYTIYVIHVAICVGMLMIMMPFGKLSHLLYRPLAIFLTTMKQKAQEKSVLKPELVRDIVGDTFQSCMQCGTCTASCPRINFVKFSPRQVLRNILLGRSTDVNVDVAAWNCASCESCSTHCPRGIPLADIMTTIREKSSDLLQPKSIVKALAELKNDSRLWHTDPSPSVPEYMTGMDFCLQTCCATLKAEKHHPNSKTIPSLTSIFDAAKLSYGRMAKEECCGEIAKVAGASQITSDLSNARKKAYLSAEVSKIVTSSPHCLRQIHDDGGDVVHSVEILAEIIKSSVITPEIELDLHVTYHDPCYLGRKAGVYDAPRTILKSIKGIKFTEMSAVKDESLCCGGGGGGIVLDDRISQTEKRLQQAIGTGAKILVTSCPFCIEMFEKTIKKAGLVEQIEVCDIASLLHQSLAISGEGLATPHLRSTDQEGIHD
ncbi:MAG: heterodisulfide reductase-related iron-sulfur binding cluster [Desulfotalea sp.]